jgi:hypothetical protein
VRSLSKEPYAAVHRCYAEAERVAQTQYGPVLLCWLDGDDDGDVEPMPVPLGQIFFESQVKNPGDSGTLVVSLDWAEQIGLI